MSLAQSARVSGALALRSLRRIRRLPSAFVPSLAMPVFMAVAFTGAFRAITEVPGFPTDDAASWFVPLAALQGAAFGGIGIGLGALGDIETGFYDRLLLAPSTPAALVAGPLLAGALRALFPVTAALAVGFVTGMEVPGGPAGVVLLVAVGAAVCLMAAGWALGLAYRVRTQAAPGLMQAGLLLAFFLSTTQVPLSVMTGWLHTVARVNPMTNVFRLARQGFLGEITWHDTWPGLLVLSVGIAATTLFAYRGVARLQR